MLSSEISNSDVSMHKAYLVFVCVRLGLDQSVEARHGHRSVSERSHYREMESTQ